VPSFTMPALRQAAGLVHRGVAGTRKRHPSYV
jgi:hypothetical protein